MEFINCTRYRFLSIFLILLSIAAIFSCRRDDKFLTDPDAQLSFSADTILFDTVFTTIGSSTRQLMVYNPYKDPLKISRIALTGGKSSFYNINIDGENKVIVYDKEIASKDSMYIFVNVRIDPTNSNNPLLVEDELQFDLNHHTQIVKLVAYGQDAHYITPDTSLAGSLPYRKVKGTWKNDKPYLVYGYAAVMDSSELIIEAGCRIYFHNNSGIWIDPGSTLKINGTADKKVFLQGDRLEAYYKNLPAQWNGIVLDAGSKNNVIDHAVIRNAVLGIQCEQPEENLQAPTLQIANTKFENMSIGGLAGNGTVIFAKNLLFDECTEYAIALCGGFYDFKHITIGNFSPTPQSSSLILKNTFEKQVDNTTIVVTVEPTEIIFENSILWGNSLEELAISNNNKGTFIWNFDHCLLKTTINNAFASNFKDCLFNKDPLFIKSEEYNYKPDTLSPVLKKGIYVGIDQDIDGAPRNMETPDLGAYEVNYFLK